MQRVSCLYCGVKFWRPLKWLRDAEFCSREHRESYHGRLRKIAGDLGELVERKDSALPAPQSEMPDEQIEREPPPLLATFLPLSNDPSIQAPLKRGPSMTQPLRPPFETRTRIKRWGLRMKFFG